MSTESPSSIRVYLQFSLNADLKEFLWLPFLFSFRLGVFPQETSAKADHRLFKIPVGNHSFKRFFKGACSRHFKSLVQDAFNRDCVCLRVYKGFHERKPMLFMCLRDDLANLGLHSLHTVSCRNPNLKGRKCGTDGALKGFQNASRPPQPSLYCYDLQPPLLPLPLPTWFILETERAMSWTFCWTVDGGKTSRETVSLAVLKGLVGFIFSDDSVELSTWYCFLKSEWSSLFCFRDTGLQTSQNTGRGQWHIFQACPRICLHCHGFSQWESWDYTSKGMFEVKYESVVFLYLKNELVWGYSLKFGEISSCFEL